MLASGGRQVYAKLARTRPLGASLMQAVGRRQGMVHLLMFDIGGTRVDSTEFDGLI
jgi:hypothetical protein